MVLYSITLIPLSKDLRSVNLGFLSPFYADEAEIDGSARRSAQLLNMLMERGPYRGYFSETAKYLFISHTPGQEEAARRGFAAEGLVLNFVSGSRYLGAYLGPQLLHAHTDRKSVVRMK